MQSIWVRFATSEGTIIGEVAVPRRCPKWFAPHLATMQEGANRQLSMEDVDVEEWLEATCSANRPILLGRPLSPQRQEELVFFPPGKLNEMRLALDQAKKDANVEPGTLLHDDAFVKKYGVFMDDLEKVPVEERGRMKPVPRKNLQPNNHLIREFTVYAPLVSPDANPSEDREKFRLNPGRVNHFVVLKANRDFIRQVEQAYQDEVPVVAVAQAAQVPPTPAFQPKA